MAKKDDLVRVNPSELSKVKDNSLNPEQLGFLFQKTPKTYIYERKGKGGDNWKYVTGAYVKKVLNLMFGWNWDFEIEKFDMNLPAKQCIVLGKLTVRTGGKTIIKNQFGRQDIKFKTEPVFSSDGKPVMISGYGGKMKQKRVSTNIPMDLGNDLKGASTDALKKCASELGVAADIYNPKEFKEVHLEDSTPLTQEEKDADTVRQRIVDHIEDSTSTMQLRQAVKELGDDEDLQTRYNDKFEELANKEINE